MHGASEHKGVITAEVIQRIEAASDVVELSFRPVSQTTFPVFRAGAHTMIELPGGLRRAYSLISDPDDGQVWRIATKLEPKSRGGSRWIFDNATPGTRLSVGYPKNAFGVIEQAAHHLLIAGGIGITPFMAMVQEIARAGSSCSLHYAVRSRKNAAFLPWLRNLLGSGLHIYDADHRLALAGILERVPENTHAYCCGPARMLQEFSAVTQHWQVGTTHTERFAAETADDPNAQASFQVTIASNDETLTVAPGYSLLNTLLDAGYELEVGCEAGVCGECVVGVLSGDVLHEDSCLSEDRRRRQMTSCVSRGRGVLKLDL